MKRTLLILIMISVILGSVIFIIYKNNQNDKEEVVEIFKEDTKEEDKKEEENTSIKKITVDIKGMVNNPGVYEVDSDSRINDQTTPNMIQGLKGIFAIKPLISRGI